jgi:hypothetical protein
LLLAALRQVRHLELAGLVSFALLTPGSPTKEEASVAGTPRGWRPLVLLAGILCALGASRFGSEHRKRVPAEWIDGGPDLLAAIDLVPGGANLYVPFSRASLAIWYGFPRGIRVFFDSRNDCYSADTFRRFLELSDPSLSGGGISRRLDQTKTDAVLVGAGHSIASALALRPDWRMSRGAGQLLVFVRSPVDVPSLRTESPARFETWRNIHE